MITLISGEPYQAGQYIEKLKKRNKSRGLTREYLHFSDIEEDWQKYIHMALAKQSLLSKGIYVVLQIEEARHLAALRKNLPDIKEKEELLLYAPSLNVTGKTKGVNKHTHFSTPQGREIQQWALKELERHKEELPDKRIINTFLDALPSSIKTLHPVVQEIEKLILAGEHYPELIERQREARPFLLTDALAKKDRQGALALLEKEFGQGQKAFDIVHRIIWQLRVLLVVSGAEKNQALSLHPFIIKKARASLRAFKNGEDRKMFLDAISLYENLLYSSLPPELLLCRFFFLLGR